MNYLVIQYRPSEGANKPMIIRSPGTESDDYSTVPARMVRDGYAENEDDVIAVINLGPAENLNCAVSTDGVLSIGCTALNEHPIPLYELNPEPNEQCL